MDELQEKIDQEVTEYEKYHTDPVLRVEDYFGLTIQEVLPEYKPLLEYCRKAEDYSEMKLYMFKPFVKGEHLTRQQGEILIAVRDAIINTNKRKITIRSGHGIGKSTILAIIIIRFLFCFYQSVVGCTAPTSDQMYDVLRKELGLWIKRLPREISQYFKWTSKYIRIQDPEDSNGYYEMTEDDFDSFVSEGAGNAWFARARTASKDRPEALAGLHADDMLIVVDEASGVEQAVFDTSKGALTNDNVLFIMISNPTRLEGYFYDSFHKIRNTFHIMNFNSEESPIVGNSIKEEIVAEHGVESDEYRIRVKGEFPLHGDMDEDGRIDLFEMNQIDFITEDQVVGFNPSKMGVDPSGTGGDSTPHAVRDELILKIAHEEKKSTSKSIALNTLGLMNKYQDILPEEVVYDNFGVGAEYGVEMADMGYRCIGVNGNDDADNKEKFVNKRAEMYWRFSNWLKTGGKLVGDQRYWDDLKMIKYKMNSRGKIQILSKEKMKKRYGKSPDRPDSAMYTFYRLNKPKNSKSDPRTARTRKVYNPFTGGTIDLSTNETTAW